MYSYEGVASGPVAGPLLSAVCAHLTGHATHLGHGSSPAATRAESQALAAGHPSPPLTHVREPVNAGII